MRSWIDDLFALGWSRPLGLLALALPLVLLLLSRRRMRPVPWAIGTLAIWKQVAPRRSIRSARSNPRVPPWVWVACAALASGALALGGPHRPRAQAPRRWTLVLDHSPSTGLAWGASPGSSRLEHALELALDWLAREVRPGDRVRWWSNVRSPLDLAPGERPPAGWLAHPRRFAPEVDWPGHDEEGALWVTDRVSRTPTRAALFASGGEARPGPVAATLSGTWFWDGARVTSRPAEVSVRPIALEPDGESIPEPLRELFALWADARGFSLVQDARSAHLVLASEAPVDAGLRLEGERDGWRVRGRGVRLARRERFDTRTQTWLRGQSLSPEGEPTGEGSALVEASPGRIRVAWSELEEPAGDPASFALSWARLFDAWVLPPPNVVPLEEREAAGSAPRVNPPADRPDAAFDGRGEGLEIWLVALAAALGALALSLMERRPLN